MDISQKIKIAEIERGLHTCQYGEGCKTDARWRVNQQYLCGRHFKLLGYDLIYKEQLDAQPTPSMFKG